MGWFDWFWSILDYFHLSNKTGKILFLGLDNAGKTTLLHQLAYDKIRVHRPTFNPNIEMLTLNGIQVKTIDMGGHENARRLWKEYFTDVDGVVFIVDAACPSRFEESKAELDGLLQSEELSRTPFVILGNKIDEGGVCPEDTLAQALGIQSLLTGKDKVVPKESGTRPLEIFMCSVTKRVGYGDAFRWLAKYLNDA
eukprot:Tbor_TRINITY_DN2996_c0_g1::TRINITY_DN2996_c0_g1_i1::g.1111::m.1111/K07953/SAR1; GTP-binding protein SAR1